ncbi:hypothetical protein ACQKLN_24915 [Paenibacillus glucanolyticus]|uniref:hypothetical protein n=1 Tax=Paenibacillus glucanolyticus TaxID=59843 RepID=UPI003689B0AE
MLKKQNPSLSDKIEVADKWIKLGHAAKRILQIVGVSEQIYYYRKKNAPYVRNEKRGGRPAPGYSQTVDEKKISDEQICEWLC